MIQDFIINVTSQASGVTMRGFTTALYLSTDIAQEEVMVIKDLSDLPEALEGTNTYKGISALLSQDYKMTNIMLVGAMLPGSGEMASLLRSHLDEDFYFVLTSATDLETIEEIAAVVETGNKAFFANIDESENPADADITKYDNTAIFLHSKDGKLAEGMAAIMSDGIGKTAKFKTVKGVKSNALPAKELVSDILKKNINLYNSRLGMDYITEGTMTGGEFIDVTLTKHWLLFRLEEDILQHFVNTENVDYTNAGIASIIDIADTRLRNAVSLGMLEKYDIEYMVKAEIPKTELANRRYDYIKVQATLSGAVHGGKVNVYLVL